MLKRENHVEIDRRKFYKTVLALVVPMALQNLINVGVTAADVIMLGAVGEKALSGASLAGQIQYIMTLFLFGLTSGATVLTAQYWGKGDHDAIEKILGMAVKAAVCVTALFTVAALAIPELLMQIFTSDPVVISEGVKYLRIVAFTYVMMGVTQAYLYIMRSVERVVVATVVYLLSLICNIIMNAIFIFGLLGLPKMGVAGAALGTLCARILEVVLVAVYARLFNREIRLRFKYVLHTDKILFRDFMQYALPVVVNEVLWGLGTAANTAILGHMGSAAVAANSVAQVARQLATVVSFGLSSAAAIYLGKTIGERKTEYAKAYAKRFLILSVIMGALGGAVILAVSPLAAAALTLTGTAKEYLKIMFFVMSYFVVGQAINTTLVVGVFRSGGDTRFGLILDMTTMWCCSILFGFLAAFVFKLSVPVVYVILMSDEIIKIPITYKRYRSYKWLNDVTR
ncbi:MATE family efflux transporter [Mediterraneibacter sp.]|uniref:MATE family efflux transporter n=1 Tax=Mediterraneibacter sp. TaxID=2316022 RepID=UPI0027B9EA00|nr:MATE family efflux transporter [Mediterraneibacter sp.]